MTMLEVFVPTYNRPVEFRKCLISLENALSYLDFDNTPSIGIAVNDNSTDYFEDYEEIIEEFHKRFRNLGISYFDYRRTGFNIGGVNNIAGGIFSAGADYVWCLPDDDLARFDSLVILINVLNQYRPCFISGALVKKARTSYDDDPNIEDDGCENKIFDVIADGLKISAFLSTNVVQLQEYVYCTQAVKNFLSVKENIHLLNDMCPGLFGLVCLQEDGPFVRLERSVGIFRDGDPKSEWRHLWVRFALIEWPQLCKKLYDRSWLSTNEYRLSIGVFRAMLADLSRRPDILLGVNLRRRVNPFLLFRYHRSAFLKALLLSPVSVSKAVFEKLGKLL